MILCAKISTTPRVGATYSLYARIDNLTERVSVYNLAIIVTCGENKQTHVERNKLGLCRNFDCHSSDMTRIVEKRNSLFKTLFHQEVTCIRDIYLESCKL